MLSLPARIGNVCFKVADQTIIGSLRTLRRFTLYFSPYTYKWSLLFSSL